TRMRAYHTSRAIAAEKNPNSIAARTWAETAFPNHPYGRSSSGTRESIAAITAQDLEDYRKRVFAQDNLKIAVVGDIDAETLKGVLDDLFGDLAPKADLRPIPDVVPTKGGPPLVVARPFPQSVAIFGKAGIPRDDDDFIAAFVMNHILGGGGFSSRLMQEVREKRGLAYSVYSYLQAYDHSAIFAGGVATQNERVAESLKIIEREIERMATEGPSKEDLANAIEYLVGSYPLRFDTNSKVAQQLLGIQEDKLGIDYPVKRNDLIRAITVEDVKRVAKRILGGDDLITVVVGSPIGLPG
ncbi:MAG: pitrilysin family protein, partial [Pseudomonadota bacterium]